MNVYEKAVLNARKKFLKLNKRQEKELLNLYKDLAKQLRTDISKCKTTSKEIYLRKLHSIVLDNIKNLESDLYNNIHRNMIEASKISEESELVYYKEIIKDNKLLANVTKGVILTNENVVKKLISGNFYKDNKSLSDRCWINTQKNVRSIDILIKENVLKGANARELALQVEKYVNPLNRTEMKIDRVGFSTKVSYNSARLARTSITHSFAESTIQDAIDNPFNIGIKWNLSRSHKDFDICDEYAEEDGFGLGAGVFPADQVPLQHPQCICNLTPVNLDIKLASKRLKAWTNGAKDKELDEWYNNVNTI